MGKGRHLRIVEGRRRRARARVSIPVLALMVFAFSAVAIADTEIDMTAPGAVEEVGGAVLRTSAFEGSTGTGVFESFVRVQAGGTEEGYNTSARPLEFNEMSSGNFTRDLTLDAVPVVDYEGTDYRQFRLDVNESSPTSLISLDVARVYVHCEPEITGYDSGVGAFGQGEQLVWELPADSYVSLDYSNFPGSGNGDMELLIPDADFAAAAASVGCAGPTYVTLYSHFGETHETDDGFEEWSVFKQAASPFITKTVTTDFTRTHEWDIDKSVSPESWDLFTGDSGKSKYTVDVTKSTTDSDFAASGTIVIHNPTDSPLRLQSVTDAIYDSFTGDTLLVTATVDCPLFALPAGQRDISAGGTEVCTWEASFEGVVGFDPETDFWNHAEAVVGTGQTQSLTTVEVVQFDLDNPSEEIGESEVTVSDTNLPSILGTFSDSGSASYFVEFTCDEDEGEIDNTATIDETGQSDDATVTVNCHELTVTKDIDTSLTRTWVWDIEKGADQTELLLSEGQLFEVNYSVLVSASSADSEWVASGTITIENDTPIDAKLANVLDRVNLGGHLADVDCGVAMSDASPYTLVAGGQLDCTYSVDLPNAGSYNNRATVRILNYAYDENLVPTFTGTTQFTTGNLEFDFSGATVNEVDECIDVTDTSGAALGEVCADDLDSEGEYEFTYSLWFGAHPDADVVLVCGENTYTNVAAFETNDTATTGDDDHTVTAEVACVLGCTLTPGYWKTHNASFWGGAPTDDTWEQILPSGEQSPFFLSGQTYFDVLWTPPKGNVYYNLAFHYIAAELNQLNGADIPDDVLAAFDAATLLFGTYTPDEIGALKGKPSDKELRDQFISLAGILGEYNEGIIGPGHCSEDTNSES